jgi:hypothetical protein
METNRFADTLICKGRLRSLVYEPGRKTRQTPQAMVFGAWAMGRTAHFLSEKQLTCRVGRAHWYSIKRKVPG